VTREYKLLEETPRPNSYRIVGDTAYILLQETERIETTVDLTNLEQIIKYRWHAAWSGHAYYVVTKTGTKKKSVKLHDILMPPISGKTVDHKDGNSLNNCYSNLRLATRSEQSANTHRIPTSGFKGVRKNGKNGWAAYTNKDGKYIHIGTYSTREEAAEAYDVVVTKLFGEFARTNRMMGLLV
jgi:HNH endonuclease